MILDPVIHKDCVSILFLSRSLNDVNGVSSGLRDVDRGVNYRTAKDGVYFCVTDVRDDEEVSPVIFDEAGGAFLVDIGGD